ncbi:TBC1 domain family member 13 [Pelomyxa schiedti]|nr:TBC1 domain family member 13 [Pelomyxa schiedti]
MLNKFTKKLGELLPVVVPKQDPQPTSAAADTAPHGDTADQPTATTTATAASTSATPTTTAAATTDAAVAVPSQVEVPVEGKPSDGSSVTGITDTGSGAKVEGKTPGTDAVDTPKDGDDGGSTKTETTPTPTKDGVEPPAPTAEPVTGGDANESGDKEKPSDTPATPQVPVSHYKQRVSQFQEAIFQGCEPATECGIQIINISAVRNMAFGGIPEQNHLREPYWKLLLNYLPLDRAKWDNYLKEQRAIYVKWKEEFFIDPHAHQASNDHPLSTQTSSVWNSFFNDAKIVEDITKDLKRTSPNLHFFTSGERANLHYNALQSILFVYAKLNPGIRYVQGMNEILAPLYYVFASHYQDPQELLNAEADTFFCFTNVMSEIRDHFIKSLDASGIGVHKTLGKMSAIIKQHDFEVWAHLEKLGVVPQYYAFRWILLMLSQVPDFISYF